MTVEDILSSAIRLAGETLCHAAKFAMLRKNVCRQFSPVNKFSWRDLIVRAKIRKEENFSRELKFSALAVIPFHC